VASSAAVNVGVEVVGLLLGCGVQESVFNLKVQEDVQGGSDVIKDD